MSKVDDLKNREKTEITGAKSSQMPTPELLNLKSSYQNGEVSIGDALIKPCLGVCLRYRRGTGYFNSSAFIHYADVLDHVIKENVKIEIICSPKIDQTLLRVIEKNLAMSESDRVRVLKEETEKILLVALGHSKNPKNIGYRERLLIYFLANDLLEIRFAIPKKIDSDFPETDERNMYHVKTGYFEFEGDSWVSFDGSFNESDGGMRWNTDRTQVFRSWKEADVERGRDVIETVDRDWLGANPYIAVLKLDEATLRILRQMSDKTRPKKHPGSPPEGGVLAPAPPGLPPQEDSFGGLWSHQKRAAETFLGAKRGILEMATGTGKTRTALGLIKYLLRSDLVRSVVVATDGNDLLDQWFRQLSSLSYENGNFLKLFAHYGPEYRDLNQFLLDGYRSPSVLVISNDNLAKALRNLDREKRERLFLIHDEVHRIGSPGNRLSLSGMSENISFLLGLSATPEREYDEDGNKFIEEYIGPTIFRYELENAIRDRILCPFEYVPITYTPSDEDKQKLAAVYSRKRASELSGLPMSDIELYIALSKVYKLSESKLEPFKSYLAKNPSILKRSIIFVEEKWYGEKVISIVHPYRSDFHTYYADDQKETLVRFAKGDLECLITCHKLSEGIDIRSLETVILFSSAKAKLETIQRIGRCLRINPDDKSKVAKVIDFVRDDATGDDSDVARAAWLSKLSEVHGNGDAIGS